MKTFTEWLSEAAFKFQKGKDQDYTNDPYEVLVFSEQAPDKYEVEGKTHGQMSHAIKHLKEFEPDFVKGVVTKVKSTIRKKLEEKPHWFCKIWNNIRGFSSISGVKAVDSASIDAVLNTLDLINDKNQMKEPLMKLDSSIKPFAVELEHKYNELVSEKIDKAVDLNKLTIKGSSLSKKIKKSQVVKFDCDGKNGGKFTVVLDFTDQSLVIGKNDMSDVTTMYRFNDTGGTKPAVIDAFFKKKLIPSNKDIKLALETL